jgi:hypothetical protein
MAASGSPRRLRHRIHHRVSRCTRRARRRATRLAGGRWQRAAQATPPCGRGPRNEACGEACGAAAPAELHRGRPWRDGGLRRVAAQHVGRDLRERLGALLQEVELHHLVERPRGAVLPADTSHLRLPQKGDEGEGYTTEAAMQRQSSLIWLMSNATNLSTVIIMRKSMRCPSVYHGAQRMRPSGCISACTGKRRH